jgi:hypothetical protein
MLVHQLRPPSISTLASYRPAAIIAVQIALPATPCVIGSVGYIIGVRLLIPLKQSSLPAHPRPQQLRRQASS